MGLLSGSVSVTRYNVLKQPSAPDFDSAAFREIDPASELRHSIGFLPLEPEAPWEVGARRWAFRVRIDRLRADPTLLRERFRDLVRAEIESGARFVSPTRRRELRELAEEELVTQTLPSSKIIDGCIDGDILYLATTAKNHLGLLTQLLRQIGVEVEPKAPWIDRGDRPVESDIISTHEPGESVLGCRFLKELVGDSEVTVEPESGYLRLQTHDTKITIHGTVFHELLHYLEQDAELLAAKMSTGESTFRFDALSYRISNLKIETGKHEHWTELLDERLEKIGGIFDMLDRKFIELGLDMNL